MTRSIMSGTRLLSISSLVSLWAGVQAGPLPVVQMHGMGDFAKNPAGMIPLAHSISKALGGVHVLNVQIGRGPVEDMANGFLMNMNDQVDYFAKVVRADPELSKGFNAIGYSQGNLVIRGYVQRYNSPPVQSFISMHGPMMGVAGLPGCNVSRVVCEEVDALAAKGAYNDHVQRHLAQANYFRDPMALDAYLAHNVFLPALNHELPNNHNSYGNGAYGNETSLPLSSLRWLVLVKALGDTVVTPNDSEWFGYFQDGSLWTVWSIEEAPWSSALGLDVMLKEGRLVRTSTQGDHLKFSQEELMELVEKYFSD